MAVEFSCLNCRHRMTADEAEIGEKRDCPECGLVVKVPVPIGRKLTDRRMQAPAVAAQTEVAKEKPELSSSQPKPKTPPKQVPVEPSIGLAIDYSFEAVLARDEQEVAVAVVEDVIEGLKQHMELTGAYYQSAGLLLTVHQFAFESVSLKLTGSVNNQPVSLSHRQHWHRKDGYQRSLATIIIDIISDIASPKKVKARQHAVRTKLLKNLRNGLDRHVGVPRPWWQFW